MFLILGVDGGADSNADTIRAGGHREDLQEEILAAMKDSGVLDEWKDKLDDMLYNNVDEKKTEKKKLPVINEQEREMLRSFIDEYKTDANLEVSTDLILSVIDRGQGQPDQLLPRDLYNHPCTILCPDDHCNPVNLLQLNTLHFDPLYILLV